MKKQKLIKAISASILAVFAFVVFASCQSKSQEKKTELVRTETPDATIHFPSKDGVPVSADVYMPYADSAPLIILCHRAFWSRGEYSEIAPELTAMGFNVIAVDLRSGDTFNNVTNRTNIAATAQDKKTRFMDSLPDIQAAVDFVSERYAPETLILWGSSYSASLGVLVAKQNPDKIDAYLAFSPGEYFSDSEQGKPADWIASEASGVTIPVFFSSDSTEVEPTMVIFNKISSADKTAFFPEGESRHGSEALFKKSPASAQTWAAVTEFLEPFALER